MPRKAAVTPNRHLHTTIPPDLMAKLDLFLWSEVEGRVPQGAYQQFVCGAIRDFFSKRTIDISNHLEGAPGSVLVTATPEDLDLILRNLHKGDLKCSNA